MVRLVGRFGFGPTRLGAMDGAREVRRRFFPGLLTLLWMFQGVFAVAAGELPRDSSASSKGSSETLASSREVVWHTDFEEGWRLARKTQRPMVIFITSSACTYCDAMKQNTLNDYQIRKKLSENFVAIKLRQEQNASVLSRVKISAYPTSLVALPKGKVVAHRIGYQPPKEFCALLSEALPKPAPSNSHAKLDESAMSSNGMDTLRSKLAGPR